MFNLEGIQAGVSRSFGRGSLLVKKHSPEILLGAGLVGMVATVVMASKATLKVNEIIEETTDNMEKVRLAEQEGHTGSGQPYSAEDATKDKAIVYVQSGLKFAKLYGPSVAMGTLSIAAILGAHGIMKNRQVALMAAYNLLAEGYKNYRARVVEELGAETDLNYHLGLKEESYSEKETDEEGNTKKVKKTRKTSVDDRKLSIYARVFDEFNSTQYRRDANLNRAFLMSQERFMNDMLILRGYLFLNEVYEALGMSWTKEGQLVGWVLKDNPKDMKREGRDGYVSFNLLNVYNDPGRNFVNDTEPSIWLDFNVDGVVYDLIEF
jgi:hypothetical protein